MQAYGAAFARVYNRQWAGFARYHAPRILDFYAGRDRASENLTLLDLGCGTGQARFVQADAAAFTFDESFGLVVSLFDALNHLPDWDALRGCFRSVRAVTRAGGMFIFDLNTRQGLKRWNQISVSEDEDTLIVNRGIYDGGDRAYAHINGFIREDDGRYSRFEETVYNTVFDLEPVRALLLETGWREAHFAHIDALGTPLEEPEGEGRVFVVASV